MKRARALIDVYAEAAYQGHFFADDLRAEDRGKLPRRKPWSKLSRAERARWEGSPRDVLDVLAEDMLGFAQQDGTRDPFGSVSPGLVKRRRGER